MCHHVPIDEREAFAEKLREQEADFEDVEEEPTEASEEPDERPEPMATPTDD